MDACEKQRILHSCHSDPTSGHLGTKCTIKTIREPFTWRGDLPKNNYNNMGPKNVTWDNIEYKNCKAAVSAFPVEGEKIQVLQ